MPFRKFVLADLFCATLVVTLFYGLTYFYGTQIMRVVHQGEGWLTIAAITGGVIVGLVFLWLYLRRRKALEAAANASQPSDAKPVA